MKVALAIYLFMLTIEASLTWSVGGSPFLLVTSIVGVLLYVFLSMKLALVAEVSRLVTSAVMVSLCPLFYSDYPNVFWFFILAIVHFLSATQCIREMQYASTAKDIPFIRITHSIFTVGFYATMVLVFMLLRADWLGMERSTGAVLALVISILGWVAWETSRVRQLKKGKTSNLLSGRGLLFRAALVWLGVVVFTLLFAVVLPIVADALCDLSPTSKSSRDQSDEGPRQVSVTQVGNTDDARPNISSDPVEGPELTNRTGQSVLPMRGTLQLSDEVRLLLKFKDPVQAEFLTNQGPLYVRTLAVSKFEDDQWVSESSSGHWFKDAMDGSEDGSVDLSKPKPGDIAHEVFFPKSTGNVLPALAGVTRYALAELYVLPDDWYQNVVTGDIRYKASSYPINIRSLTHSKIEVGNPGEAYTSKLSSPFGNQLTKVADDFMSKRPDLTGRLELLQEFFLMEFKYSMTVENKSGIPSLENFIFEERIGYCDFFASASALILRHMGIPSRVAYGYKDGEYDATADAWIFREYDAHAWTEIYLEGHGWVICDFTPPSADPARHAVTPLSSFDIAQFKDAGDYGIENEIKLWNPSQSMQAPWLPVILGFGLLGAIVSFLIRKPRTPAQRAAIMAARKRTESDKQPDYFLEFLRMCEAFGYMRPKGQTLMEFHQRLKHAQFCNEHFDDLADYYYKSRYEDAPKNESIERRFLKRIREFWKSKG